MAKIKEVEAEVSAAPAAPAGVDVAAREAARKELADARKAAGEAHKAEDEAHAAALAADGKVTAATLKLAEVSAAKRPAPKGLVATSVGLPNSCSECGEPIVGDTWYATSEEAAAAGLGLCERDAQKWSSEHAS